MIFSLFQGIKLATLLGSMFKWKVASHKNAGKSPQKEKQPSNAEQKEHNLDLEALRKLNWEIEENCNGSSPVTKWTNGYNELLHNSCKYTQTDKKLQNVFKPIHDVNTSANSQEEDIYLPMVAPHTDK